jgi:hypothetical protein
MGHRWSGGSCGSGAALLDGTRAEGGPHQTGWTAGGAARIGKAPEVEPCPPASSAAPPAPTSRTDCVAPGVCLAKLSFPLLHQPHRRACVCLHRCAFVCAVHMRVCVHAGRRVWARPGVCALPGTGRVQRAAEGWVFFLYVYQRHPWPLQGLGCARGVRPSDAKQYCGLLPPRTRGCGLIHLTICLQNRPIE